MTSPLLKMVNIHKNFKSVHALRGVDFSVKSSEIVGLVGDNGAGKSTLIKIIMGLYPADEGEIYFKGKKVNFSSPRDARDNGIEAIYQEQALADDVSIARNIFMGNEPQKSIGPIKLLDHKKMGKESKRILNELGLGISPDREARHCSGGERQGIAIARAIYFKARLVILDEPTRALGVRATKRVLNLVKELKSTGISVIYISHNLHRVYPIVDRLVVLIRGEKIKDTSKKNTSIDELIEVLS